MKRNHSRNYIFDQERESNQHLDVNNHEIEHNEHSIYDMANYFDQQNNNNMNMNMNNKGYNECEKEFFSHPNLYQNYGFFPDKQFINKNMNKFCKPDSPKNWNIVYEEPDNMWMNQNDIYHKNTFFRNNESNRKNLIYNNDEMYNQENNCFHNYEQKNFIRNDHNFNNKNNSFENINFDFDSNKLYANNKLYEMRESFHNFNDNFKPNTELDADFYKQLNKDIENQEYEIKCDKLYKILNINSTQIPSKNEKINYFEKYLKIANSNLNNTAKIRETQIIMRILYFFKNNPEKYKKYLDNYNSVFDFIDDSFLMLEDNRLRESQLSFCDGKTGKLRKQRKYYRKNELLNLQNRKLICSHCCADKTSLWRKLNGHIVCNACGLYYRIHGVERPANLCKKKMVKRTRKKPVDWKC